MSYIYRAKEVKAGYTSKYDPTASNCDMDSCIVNGSNAWVYRAFVKHDLSGLPQNANIISAKLYVYCNYHNDSAASTQHKFSIVTEDWDEPTMCWNNMPAVSSVTYPADWLTAPALNSWGIYDITGIVQDWVSQTYPNYGMQFVNNGEGGYRKNWEFANHRAGEELATYIEVEYEADETLLSVTHERMRQFAREARRITGATDQMTPQEAVTAFESYKLPIQFPAIPSDMLGAYPYAIIHDDPGWGDYRLYLCAEKMYYAVNTSNSIEYLYPSGVTKKCYKIASPGLPEWTPDSDVTSMVSLYEGRKVLWSNYDIPNGSASATEIYFLANPIVIKQG